MNSYIIYQGSNIINRIVCLPSEIQFYITDDLQFMQWDGQVSEMQVVNGQVVPQ